MRTPKPFIAVGAALAIATAPAQASGIPVIDVANLIQSIQQVLNDLTDMYNQIQQLQQLRAQVESINGMRNLGSVLDNPMLKNYVPAEAYTVVNAVRTAGYGGLTGTAKALRDAEMIYNCGDKSGSAKMRCQADLAEPYTHKGMLQDAMKSAAGRLTQIQALMRQVDATADQKAVLEIQARITAENAQLSHEVSQVQMLGGMADSQERIARSRDRERQYESLRRVGKISDYLR